MKNNKGFGVIAIIILVAVVAAGYWIAKKYYYPRNKTTPPAEETANPNPAAGLNENGATTIKIQDFAFNPPTITVKSGTTITWVNNDNATHQIASDPHPTHADLPGLVSPVLPLGGQYSFTFSQIGSFGYHCLLHPSMTARVIVEP